MDAKIFFFSGTGNSLYVAKEIVKTIDSCSLVSIPGILKYEELIVTEEIIGFIFPVYSYDCPLYIKSLIAKLNFKSNPHIFSVATNNGGPGRANFNLDRLLEKRGKHLHAGFTVTMPGNSIIVADFTNTVEERKKRLEKSNEKISKIADYIKNRVVLELEGDNRYIHNIKGIVTKVFRLIYNVPKHFRVSERCVKCSCCVKLCPENNIVLEGEKIGWGNRCSNCLSCFHWCPQKAIELGTHSMKKLRYHHPDIKINELFLR